MKGLNIHQKSLESFFCGEFAERAAAGFSDKVCIAVEIDQTRIFFIRKNHKNKILTKEPTRPDVIFWISENAMQQLIDLSLEPGSTLGLLGVNVFERMFSSDPEQKIRFRVEASFLSLFSKGYFSVLKAGGPEVASYLAHWGFNFTKIKDVLRNARG